MRAFRPVDVQLAASALHGAVTGMMFWYRPGRGVSVDVAVRAVVDILMRGLVVDDPSAGGARAALDSARTALDYLEVALASEDARDTGAATDVDQDKQTT